jgi:hypothetical protein
MILKSNIVFSVRLFGYTFNMVRYPNEQIADLADKGQGRTAHGAYIKQMGNYLIAVNEYGEYIKAQRKLTLKDNVNEISTVVVEYPFAGIYNDTPTPIVTEEDKKFINRVDVDANDISRRFNPSHNET